MHALAAWRVHQLAPDRAFLRGIYPRLVAQQEYLRTHRRLAGDGLVAIVHPWESGMDNSPAWDEPLAAVPAGRCGHAAARPRPTSPRTSGRPTCDYQRYIALAVAYRDGGYRDDRLLDEHAFVVADPLFNAAYGAAEAALADIAADVGGTRARTCEEAEAVTGPWWSASSTRRATCSSPATCSPAKALAADSAPG